MAGSRRIAVRSTIRIAIMVLWLAVGRGTAHAAPQALRQHDESAIQQVLDTQVAAWNRGDVDGFMRGYKNSPDTTFVGKTVEHGYADILRRYLKAYASKQQMGQLTFSGLEVRILDAKYATVTGRFDLERDAGGGGHGSGIFSLVCEKTPTGWKIVLDHTS